MNPATVFSTDSAQVEPVETPVREAAPATFVVGDYTVGDSEDELLNGHPDIRY